MTMKSMSRKAGRFLSFLQDKSGVSAVEYALIIVAVIAIIGAGAVVLGDAFEALFADLASEMSSAAAVVETAAGN